MKRCSGGDVVEKEELIRQVWQDAFVEETNLTKNISVLRGAASQQPTYEP